MNERINKKINIWLYPTLYWLVFISLILIIYFLELGFLIPLFLIVLPFLFILPYRFVTLNTKVGKILFITIGLIIPYISLFFLIYFEYKNNFGFSMPG